MIPLELKAKLGMELKKSSSEEVWCVELTDAEASLVSSCVRKRNHTGRVTLGLLVDP